MTPRCVGEPVSHLRFERLLQGDLRAGERARVEQHLRDCEVCRSCFEALRADRVVLPPLPVGIVPRRARVARRWPQLTAALALAAAALLWLRPRPEAPASRLATKGGELAIELVREHHGNIASDATRWQQGDAFQVRVTCAAREPRYWELVVRQAGEAFFPAEPGQRLTCANGSTLPAAFTLDGTGAAEVCVVLGERPLSREALRGGPLPEPSACTRLEPALR